MVEAMECQDEQQAAERRLAIVDGCQGDYSGPFLYKGRVVRKVGFFLWKYS